MFPTSHSCRISIFLPFISLFCEFCLSLNCMFLPYNIQGLGNNLKVGALCYSQLDPLSVLLTGGDGHLGQGGCGHAVGAWLPSIPLIFILQWISEVGGQHHGSCGHAVCAWFTSKPLTVCWLSVSLDPSKTWDWDFVRPPLRHVNRQRKYSMT